jgi:hypothetical protein
VSVLALGLLAARPAGAGTPGEELLVNGGFETGDATGWTVVDHPEPYTPLAVVGAGVTSPYGLFTTEPNGTRALVHGFDGGGPGTIDLSQEVTIPDGLGARLTFDLRAGWDLQRWCAGCDRARTVSVQVRDPGGTVLATIPVLSVAPGTSTPDTGTLPVEVDLGEYSGLTVVVAIVADVPGDFTGPARVQIDDVSVRTEALSPGEPPAGPAVPVFALPRYVG